MPTTLELLKILDRLWTNVQTSGNPQIALDRCIYIVFSDYATTWDFEQYLAVCDSPEGINYISDNLTTTLRIELKNHKAYRKE